MSKSTERTKALVEQSKKNASRRNPQRLIEQEEKKQKNQAINKAGVLKAELRTITKRRKNGKTRSK